MNENVKYNREDGWVNIITGVGMIGKDKRLGAKANWQKMNETEAENYYASDDISERIVDKLPKEALRSVPTFVGVDKPKQDQIWDRVGKLNWKTKFFQAWQAARMYGGSCLMFIDGSLDFDKPRDPKRPVIKLQMFNCHELAIQQDDLVRDPFDARYGEPNFYRLRPRGAAQVEYRVHHTRMIRFDGSLLPEKLFISNGYWHDSALNKPQEIIRDFNMSFHGVANMLEDISVAKFKIKDLAQMLATGNDTAVQNRIAAANLCKANLRAILLDADREDFSYEARNVSGVEALLMRLETRLATASNMPKTVLLGLSPEGLGGSGRHEQQNWYDTVVAEQGIYLKPRLMQLLANTCLDIVPNIDTLDAEFSSLYEADEGETLKNRETQAKIDAIYIDKGVIDSTEVAESRFGGDSYSHETTIDMELRKTMEEEINDNDEETEETDKEGKTDPA